MAGAVVWFDRGDVAAESGVKMAEDVRAEIVARVLEVGELTYSQQEFDRDLRRRPAPGGVLGLGGHAVREQPDQHVICNVA